jgi:hypothetical protein
LIAAGISLAIIAAVNGLGTKLNAKFTSINASLHQNLDRWSSFESEVRHGACRGISRTSDSEYLKCDAKGRAKQQSLRYWMRAAAEPYG